MTDNTAACTQTEPGLAALPTHRDPGFLNTPTDNLHLHSGGDHMTRITAVGRSDDDCSA